MSGIEQSAGQALIDSAVAALAGLPGLNGAYDGPPLQAAFPYATVEAGPESDWSHKSGEGRQLRLVVTVRDQGERPARLRAMVRAAETAMAGLGAGLSGVDGGWRLVNLVFLRSQLLRGPGAAWAAAIEYRARLLAE